MHAEFAGTTAVVVDASVVVELLTGIRWQEPADRFFRWGLATGVRFCAPDLLYAEVVSALSRLVRDRVLRPAEGARMCDQLGRLPVHPCGTSGLVAELWKLQGRVTPYDACYIALANRMSAPLVTGDEKLLRTKAAQRGVFIGSL